MEMLSSVWVWVLSVLGGLSVTGVLTAVIYGALKGAFNKTISKINVQKIAEQATEKGVERVKKISFTHNIQPLCESELKKINEQSNEYINKAIKNLESKLDKIILIQEKQARYFDNSIGVSDEAKEELKKAIEEAKTIAAEPVESIIVEEVVENQKPVETRKNKVSR